MSAGERRCSASVFMRAACLASLSCNNRYLFAQRLVVLVDRGGRVLLAVFLGVKKKNGSARQVQVAFGIYMDTMMI